ncbi:hypothetical protein Y032_0005g2579 [Ancylostoma ceylanicum]|uniref:Uncharacterized protein n=1 Tax=Ancylostoma ceylanicum TaxID=53326 RepID=A0A016VSM2_9BILA|nr:hypothetical protein Y032_0005g2579 [Ancylostoma ceylanicum]
MSTFPDKGQLLQAPRHPESPNQQLSRKWLQRTFLVLLALGVMNNYQEKPDSLPRRLFHRERCGRAACFLRSPKGHRHRCPL